MKAARAVVYAADHPSRREYWVGLPTVGTLIANKVAAGLLDRFLAWTGYESQQPASRRIRADRPTLDFAGRRAQPGLRRTRPFRPARQDP
jgi:hypothetical protein